MTDMRPVIGRIGIFRNGQFALSEDQAGAGTLRGVPKQTKPMAEEPAASEMQRQAGARIRAIRELGNVSQENISEAVGVDQSTWSKWERGERMPEVYAMAKFAGRSKATLDLIYRGRTEAAHPTLVQLLRTKVPHLLVIAPTNTDQDMGTALASYRTAIEMDRL